MTEIVYRAKKRIPDADDVFIEEFTRTISDRLNIRLGTKELPKEFESICVDAVVKMYRRIYYEGISSEGAANISTAFVEDILAEYAQEIGTWRTNNANSGNGSGRVVSFL